jgi:hypothetical protein
MDEAFAYKQNVLHYQLKNPTTVTVIDSHLISSGNIIDYLNVNVLFWTTMKYSLHISYLEVITPLPLVSYGSKGIMLA